ncbi:hypothetical protein ACJ41O_003110 [Fusarium nematophilum]
MSDIIFDNHRREPHRQTFIIPLTYPDISLGAADIPRISYGGDIWEVRADLLTPSAEPLGPSNLPPLAYVRSQLQLLQHLSQLPILFTIRTVSQGGKFPDTAEEEALDLMLMAVDEGCRYIDVEIEWPRKLIATLVEKKGDAKLVASFHDWTGGVRWTSDLLQEKFVIADEFGDIIKLSILSTDVYDCHELALFVRRHLAENPKPLLAVGMGQHGQLSRVLSPISLVTHKLLPAPSAPGQLTLAEVHHARHLIGQLPRQEFFVIDSSGYGGLIRDKLTAGFNELGLPHHCSVLGGDMMDEAFSRLIRKSGFGGVAMASFEGFTCAKHETVLDSMSADATRVGFVDTMLLKGPGSCDTLILDGENLSWQVLHDATLQAGLQTSQAGTSVAIFGSHADRIRASCLAVERLGYKMVQIPESSLTHTLAKDFPDLHFTHHQSKCGLVICCDEGAEVGREHILNTLLGGSPAGVIIDLSDSGEVDLKELLSSHPGWEMVGKEELDVIWASLLFSLWVGRRAPQLVMREAVRTL